MRPIWDLRFGDDDAEDALEFATLMYTYNRGLFGNMNTAGCTAEKNPITECKFDGYGGHSTDINNVCRACSSATEVYDFDITWINVEWFINKLHESYPYEEIEHIHGKIEWDTILSKTQEAYTIVYNHRKDKKPSARGISFRYDWRLLLAVIRAYLPEKETFYGPTMEYVDVESNHCIGLL